MKGQFAPGPWKLNSAGQVVTQSGEIVIANPYKSGGNSEANAALISAAPDLLNYCLVLANALDNVSDDAFHKHLVEQARAAILKAKGEGK